MRFLRSFWDFIKSIFVIWYWIITGFRALCSPELRRVGCIMIVVPTVAIAILSGLIYLGWRVLALY